MVPFPGAVDELPLLQAPINMSVPTTAVIAAARVWILEIMQTP
jgi:hypothetical protein